MLSLRSRVTVERGKRPSVEQSNPISEGKVGVNQQHRQAVLMVITYHKDKMEVKELW
jgi:hypothetical protein